jgi:hypothetical protein
VKRNGKTRPVKGQPSAAVRYEERDLASLKPDPDNPRKISDRALKGLTHSVRRFGLVEPIIVNETTGHVVGGHQRLKALQALGHKRTTVVIGAWTKAEERVLNTTLNNRSLQGDFVGVDDYLSSALQGITQEDFQELSVASLMPKAAKETRQSDALTYKLVITCTGERHQRELLERFDEEGLDVAPLIA